MTARHRAIQEKVAATPGIPQLLDAIVATELGHRLTSVGHDVH